MSKLKRTERNDELSEIGITVAKRYFDVDLYYTQGLILGAILDPDIKEVCIITPTRYGKTFTIGMGALVGASLYDWEVQIGASDKEKSKIAMTKVMRMLPTADKCIAQNLIGGDTLTKLSQTLSKNKLGWSSGGSIDIFSVSERLKNTDISGQGAIGLGGDLIILDESALISDENYATVRRMLAESSHTKLVEISNPHRKRHFYDSMNNPEVFTVWIDTDDAIEEGRFNIEDVQRAKRGMGKRAIKVFFDCEFVDELENGFFTEDLIASTLSVPILNRGIRVMGIDVARSGGDRIVYAIGRRRGDRFTIDDYIIENTGSAKIPVTHVAGKALAIAKDLKIVYIGVDVLGLGAGVFDILDENGEFEVEEFIASAQADNKKTYANRKAEVADNFRQDMGAGFVSLPKHDGLYRDLSGYAEEFDSQGRVKLADPADSPDIGDATLIAYSIAKEPRDAELTFL